MQNLASETVIRPAARNERSQIAGMLQPYLAELSAFTALRPNGNGRYPYPYLDGYWEDDSRFPYLIELGRDTIGFALIRAHRVGKKTGHSVAEFYIKPEFRRHGYGRSAALALLRTFPGKWRVRQFLMHHDAQAFWREVVGELDRSYSEKIETGVSGRSGTVQTFVVSQGLAKE